MQITAKDTFKDRFRSVVERVGGSKLFAEKTDVSYSSTRKYLTGSEPTRAVLSKIVRTCDVDAFWLLTGEAKKRDKKSSPLEHQPRTSDQDHINIPYFNYGEYERILQKNLDFRARDDALSELATKSPATGGFPLKKSKIEFYQLNDTDSLFCYVMQDNSMAPDIPIGSDLIIDISRKSLEPGKVYLFRYEGNPIVRKATRVNNSQDWTLEGNSEENSFTTSQQILDENNCIIGLVSYAFTKKG